MDDRMQAKIEYSEYFPWSSAVSDKVYVLVDTGRDYKGFLYSVLDTEQLPPSRYSRLSKFLLEYEGSDIIIPMIINQERVPLVVVNSSDGMFDDFDTLLTAALRTHSERRTEAERRFVSRDECLRAGIERLI